MTSERLKKEIAFLEFERPRMARWTDSDESLLRAYRELLTLREEREGIPVTERMPEQSQDVLAYFSVQGWHVTSWFQWETMPNPLWSPGIREWGEVTHWLPLPTPPEPRSEA